jgi:hypothetical protein
MTMTASFDTGIAAAIASATKEQRQEIRRLLDEADGVAYLPMTHFVSGLMVEFPKYGESNGHNPTS